MRRCWPAFPGATYFDTFAFLNGIEADPAAYGITNLTTPCFNGTTVCADPSQYLFWDDVHPTTSADALLAAQFDAAVTTPEPPRFSCLALGSPQWQQCCESGESPKLSGNASAQTHLLHGRTEAH